MTSPPASSASGQLKDWERQLNSVIEDFELTRTRQIIWRAFVETVRNNPAIDRPHAFYWMLTDWYMTTQLTAVRRTDDTTKTALSLRRLLGQMLNAADVLLQAPGLVDLIGYSEAQQPEKQRIASIKQRVDADLKLLDGTCADAASHVNKLIAHLDPNAPNKLVNVAELDTALDALDPLLRRCWLLLTNEDRLLTPIPDFMRDWESIFQVPWIPPRQQGRA